MKVNIKSNAGQSAMHLLVPISNRSAQPFLRYDMTSKTGSGPLAPTTLEVGRPKTIGAVLYPFPTCYENMKPIAAVFFEIIEQKIC